MAQNNDYTPITRGEVLALDIATHTGFYSDHERGTWDFTESKRRNDNKQHKAFRDKLVDFIQKYGIKQIVAEDVSCGRVASQFKATIKLSEFRGVLLEVCDTLGLPEPVFLNLRTIKSWATGNGNADKATMIKYCQLRWKTDPVDDNEADATHIFMYYVRKFNLQ